jgi:hypothetical protein
MTSDGNGCHKSRLQQLEPESTEEEKRLSFFTLFHFVGCFFKDAVSIVNKSEADS